MLSFQDVSLHFGGIKALDGVTFDVPDGSICGLIGPNGAGKTSLFNCATRVYQPSAGRILLDDEDLLTVPAHRIAGRGVSRTYQNVALFSSMTVLENAMMGAHHRKPPGHVRSLTGLFGVRSDRESVRREALEVLEWLELDSLRDAPANGLPFGTLKRIELARALLAQPRVLLLDEPAGGLTREEVSTLGELVLAIRDRFGLSVLMVEHHLGLVGQICDHLVALNFGRILVTGSPEAVTSHPDVVRAYVGADA